METSKYWQLVQNQYELTCIWSHCLWLSQEWLFYNYQEYCHFKISQVWLFRCHAGVCESPTIRTEQHSQQSTIGCEMHAYSYLKKDINCVINTYMPMLKSHTCFHFYVSLLFIHFNVTGKLHFIWESWAIPNVKNCHFSRSLLKNNCLFGALL